LSGIAPTSVNIGDYYIVNIAGVIGSVSYSVGDWIVLSAVGDWERINNSNLISSVYGRTGAIIGTKGDYTLTKMGDVDLTTTAPVTGNVLQYNGTNWIPAVVSGGGGGSVTTVSGTTPITVTTGSTTPVISMAPASTSANGYLSSTDWNAFNAKVSSVNPSFTGMPLAPTAVIGTSTTQLATTAFVINQIPIQVLSSILTGFNSASNAIVVATDNILQAFGKTQAQINVLTAMGGSYVANSGGSTISGTTALTGALNVSTGTGLISIMDAPINGTDAVNKGYVDSRLTSIANGHIINTGASVSGLTCTTGGAPSFAAGSNDARGAVTFGTGAVTSCSITFNSTYSTPPFCVASWRATTSGTIGSLSTAAIAVNTTVTNFTVSFPTMSIGASFVYYCME
jgi:hypothetical protein